jgi:hypothetical protein
VAEAAVVEVFEAVAADGVARILKRAGASPLSSWMSFAICNGLVTVSLRVRKAGLPPLFFPKR